MTVLIFFLVLSGLVLAHELGHYLAARLFGIKAHEFGVGLPPRLIGLVKNGKKWKWVGRGDRGIYKRTVLSLNWLPFGGFVRIKGEDASETGDHDSLPSKPIWQRMIVISAGVFMNWVVAAALLSVVLMLGIRAELDHVPKSAHIKERVVAIAEVLPGSPADRGDVQPGDVILTVNGRGYATANETLAHVREAAAAGPVFLQLKRDGGMREVNLNPEVLEQIQAPGIGVGLADIGIVSFGPMQAVGQGILLTGRMTKAVVSALGGILSGLFLFKGMTQDVAGPVGIAIMTGQAAQTGIATLLQFAAMLSINLAVINILPIPALDGGRLLFMIIEKVRGRPVNRRFEIGAHNIAYIALILLILLVTMRDIGIHGGAIAGGLKNLFGL